MNYDENIQVNGVLYLMDFGGFEVKHQMWWGLDDIKNSFKLWQVSITWICRDHSHCNRGTSTINDLP